MNLTERLDMAKRLVEAGVIRDTEGAIAAIRAMEPTRPAMCMAVEYQKGTCVFPSGHMGQRSYEHGNEEVKPVDVARRIEEQISGAYSQRSRGVMVGLGASLPPEEVKPPARAHLKGCVLDTDHEGRCVGVYSKAATDAATKARGECP